MIRASISRSQLVAGKEGQIISASKSRTTTNWRRSTPASTELAAIASNRRKPTAAVASEKSWIDDPARIAWEAVVTTGDITVAESVTHARWKGGLRPAQRLGLLHNLGVHSLGSLPIRCELRAHFRMPWPRAALAEMRAFGSCPFASVTGFGDANDGFEFPNPVPFGRARACGLCAGS